MIGQISKLALPESHAKSTVESLSHFPNYSKKPVRWPEYLSVRGAGRGWAFGPASVRAAAHRAELRASGITDQVLGKSWHTPLFEKRIMIGNLFNLLFGNFKFNDYWYTIAPLKIYLKICLQSTSRTGK